METNNSKLKSWMRTHHPTTIVNDRYDGIYSGGRWLAFPLEHYEVPRDVDGVDRACARFWDEYEGPVGKGDSPESALSDLVETVTALLSGNGSLEKPSDNLKTRVAMKTKKNEKAGRPVTLGFDPHGGKLDLMWLRLEHPVEKKDDGKPFTAPEEESDE